jgi:predicted O-methyltransferase YrrM
MTPASNQHHTVHRASAVVDSRRRLTLDDMPFAADEPVDVIVVPAGLRAVIGRLLELFVRAAQPAVSYRWTDAVVPSTPRVFADLLFLFELSPLNRGLARMDIDEAAAVFESVAALPHAHGIEIGRFNGGSTFLLAAAVGAQGLVDTIDIAPHDDAGLAAALEQAGMRERVRLMVGDAGSVDTETDTPYDFAFIDGDHAYESARRDHNRWGRRVRTGGLIIHHDMAATRRFASQCGELARLRNDILRAQQSELQLLREIGSVTIFRRTAPTWTDVEARAEAPAQFPSSLATGGLG